MKYVILMGAPGAGKGTQARLLEAALHLPQVATGDLFRHNLKNQNRLGQLAQSYMDRGELVPDDVTVDMVRERLSQPDCATGAILDGFPRTLAQAVAFDSLLAELNGRICVVPYIHVDVDVLVARLLQRAAIEGRADDNEETIQKRMVVYQQQTTPLLDYYREKGALVQINGDQPVAQVQQDLLHAVAMGSQ
ncbi:MAG: adenylate kinase [Anaerolinea sp.]|nr:adenylate kinase [Anaerolinea sp.]